MTWRSSTLNLAADHCPAALDFYESSQWYPRDRFATGTAAHAVVEACGRAATLKGSWLTADEAQEVAERVAESLVREGRSFDGHPEPPLPINAVARGVSLALDYQRHCPVDPTFRYELLLAVDREFRPVDPDAPTAWLVCQIDAIGYREPNMLDDLDPLPGRCVAVRDMKSAWSADDEELSTLQRKIQAVVAWAHFGSEGLALSLEILNLRRRRAYECIIEPSEPEGAAELEAYRVAIRAAVAAVDSEPGQARLASPGAGCVRCPYLGACPAAVATMAANDPLGDPQELAARYVVHMAEAQRLRELLEPLAEDDPIELPEGRALGWASKISRRMRPGAVEQIAGEWSARAAHGAPSGERDARIAASLPGLVKALKPGVAGLQSVASVLYHRELTDYAERRAAAVGRWTREEIGRSWGVITAEDLPKPKKRAPRPSVDRGADDAHWSDEDDV